MELEHALVTFSPLKITQLENSLLTGVPLQYLLGFTEFYGNRFHVDERVLVPRSETEYMVELLMELRTKKKTSFSTLLDVGTGSGVVLLSLLAGGFASTGTGSDISEDSLRVARMNSEALRLSPDFVRSDRFTDLPGRFEVIVSNPPYIKKKSHAAGVHRAVDEHEPHLALYLEDATYEDWFAEFFQGVFSHLEAGGLFMMEGHEAELAQQAKQLERFGFHHIRVIPDLTGRDRFLEARKL